MRNLPTINLRLDRSRRLHEIGRRFALAFVTMTLLLDTNFLSCQGEPKAGGKEVIRAAECVAHNIFSDDLREAFVTSDGTVNFQYIRGGVPGTNEVKERTWTFVFYSLDAKKAVIASAKNGPLNVVHVSPFVDTFERGSDERWLAVDVGGAAGTADATERFLNKISSTNSIYRTTKSKAGGECVADKPQ